MINLNYKTKSKMFFMIGKVVILYILFGLLPACSNSIGEKNSNKSKDSTLIIDKSDGWKNVKGKANDFTMTTFDGKTINSVDLLGKVIILEFWDTHCGPCLQLMPELVQLSDKYKDNPKVAIFIVNAGWEMEHKAKSFIDRKKYQFNATYMTKTLSRQLGVYTLPATIIIDKDFNLRFKHLGFKEKTEKNIVNVFDLHIQTLLK